MNMTFERGWRQRRAAAQAKGQRNTSAYREYSSEMGARDRAGADYAAFQTKHSRLVDEKALLERELALLQERANEDNKLVGPSHPVVLKLRELPALIAAAVKELKAAEGFYRQRMAASDARLAEMKARHDGEADRLARAEAAAEASFQAIMDEELPK